MQWNSTSTAARSLGMQSGGRMRLDSGKDDLPLRTDSCISHAVETKDEETLKVDADHEHRLQRFAHARPACSNTMYTMVSNLYSFRLSTIYFEL